MIVICGNVILEVDVIPLVYVRPVTVNCVPLYVKPDCAIAPFGVPSEVNTLVNAGS